MTDQWTWYRAALAAKEAGKPLPAVDANTIQSGFFWAKAGRSGGRVPVAIWRDDEGKMLARWGHKKQHDYLTPDKAGERWSWIADNPTNKHAYTYAWTNGAWEDGTPTTAPDAAPAAGDNLPSDPFDKLQAEVADKIEQAERFLAAAAAKVADRVLADTARNMQAQLLALNKTADVQHRTEKQPHLEAGRAIDAKFRFRDKVDAIAGRLRTVCENFMRAEEGRLRAEADRKYREEQARIVAERERIEVAQAKLMRDDPIQALTSPAPEMPELPSAPEPINKVTAGGGIGRAMGLRSDWVGTITDYAATVAYFAEHPDVREAIEKLVRSTVKATKSKTVIPGVIVREVRRAA